MQYLCTLLDSYDEYAYENRYIYIINKKIYTLRKIPVQTMGMEFI